MFHFHGTEGIDIASETLYGVKCPVCEELNYLHLSVTQFYFHIWFVPVFPTFKAGKVQCWNCYTKWEEPFAPGLSGPALAALLAITKTPLKIYTGLIAGVLLLIIGTVYEYDKGIQEKHSAQLATEPRIGDVYQVRGSGVNYYYLKVRRIEGDNIFVTRSRNETGKTAEIANFTTDTLYNLKEDTLTKYDIKEFYKSNLIVDVYRNK